MTSWAPLDLEAALSGSVPAERPARLRLDDGSALLYPGRLHSLAGEPSGGKTWIAAHAVAEALLDVRVAIVIDLEDSARLWVDRLRRLGVDDKAIGYGLRYVRPSDRLDADGVADLRVALDEMPALVILDAFSGLLNLEGADPNSGTDVERTYRRVLRPIRESGAAVLLLDHVTKSRESRGRWALGSERKLSALDGASYVLDVVRPFGRGRRGYGRLVIAKDRLGEVGTPGDVVADVHLEDNGTNVDLRLEAPAIRAEGEPFRPTVLMARVSQVLQTAGAPLSSRQIEERVTGKATGVRLAVAALVTEGNVTTTEGPRGAVMHHLVAEFVDEDAA